MNCKQHQSNRLPIKKQVTTFISSNMAIIANFGNNNDKNSAVEEGGEFELSSEKRRELLGLIVNHLKCKEGGELESEACKNNAQVCLQLTS